MPEPRCEPQNGGPVMQRIEWFARHNICMEALAPTSNILSIVFTSWPNRSALHLEMQVSSWRNWVACWRKMTILAFEQWKQRGLEGFYARRVGP